MVDIDVWNVDGVHSTKNNDYEQEKINRFEWKWVTRHHTCPNKILSGLIHPIPHAFPTDKTAEKKRLPVVYNFCQTLKHIFLLAGR